LKIYDLIITFMDVGATHSVTGLCLPEESIV